MKCLKDYRTTDQLPEMGYGYLSFVNEIQSKPVGSLITETKQDNPVEKNVENRTNIRNVSAPSVVVLRRHH